MIRIREGVESDLPRLVELYQQLGSGDGGITLPRLRALFDRLARYPNYRLYVAEQEGAVLGTFLLLIYDALGFRAQPAGLVEDVVVDASARRKGIGRAMMEFAMQRCREAGCYKLTLSSNANREEAHRFYQSLGFQRHGFSFEVILGSRNQ